MTTPPQKNSPLLSRPRHRLSLACLLIAGCQSAPRNHAISSPIARVNDTPAPRLPAPEKNGIAAATDPCALRMQDLCGAFLLYFVANKHLPQKLEQLQPYSDAGATLAFICPTSNQPYIYNSTGLTGTGIRDTLILYDATPAHEGERWGIVMVPPAAGKPVLMYVIPLSEKLLKAYGGKT